MIFNSSGLTSAQALSSRQKYGANLVTQKKRDGVFRRLMGNMSDPIIKILVIALAINTVLTFKNINWAETAGILIAITVASVVSTVCEYGSERAFDKMKLEAAVSMCRVLRDGAVTEIPISETVVGDIIFISAGEKIAADGWLLSGEVSLDLSALNGESRPSERVPLMNFKNEELRSLPLAIENPSALFTGAIITKGEGYMVVVAVGDKTMYGAIASELQEQTRTSPMKLRLEKLAKSISILGYIAAGTVAGAYLFNAFVTKANFNGAAVLAGFKDLRYVAATLTHALTIAITVIVVAVPEGLPMMITVVLSSNMKKMLRDKVMVKKLVGIETAGSMNLLFCDKTGTVTTGRLKVGAVVTGDMREYSRAADITGPRGELLRYNAAYNTGAVISSSARSKKKISGGNGTERSLLEFFDNQTTKSTVSVSYKQPFDSERKLSLCRIFSPGKGGESATSMTIIKGAPEKLLPGCDYYIDERGNRQSLAVKTALHARISRAAAERGRVLAVAMCDRDAREESDFTGLTLVALIIIKDEIRREASSAVEELRGAGIQTVMITGDSKETAVAIARECAIMPKFSDVIEGKRAIAIDSAELARLDDGALRAILPELCVVARALPSDKSRLVRVAQEAGRVVGMTGDGINDAPALKRADVGFAMGDGAEIAKEAGDIIIMNNNLGAIAKAILYGRTIFKSIRRFICFQLTMNLCAVGVSLIGQIIGIESPITVVQMLWVNIIMDTLGALAFAGEAPLKSYMRERPKRRDENILNKSGVIQVLIMGGFSVALCAAFLLSERVKNYFGYFENPTRYFTAFFALFIFCSVGNCFAARTERLKLTAHLAKNKGFIAIMSGIIVIQMFMLYFGGATFRCVGLPPRQLLTVIAAAAAVFPIDFMRKLAMKKGRGKKKTL